MKSRLTTLVLLIIVTTSQAQWHKVSYEKTNTFRFLNGEIEAVNKATVSSQTTGRVEKLYYDVDDFVAKNTILVEFTNTEQKAKVSQANANANAAKIAFDQAEMDYIRIKDIFAKKLVAKSQLDQSLSNRNALEAKLAAANAAAISAKKQLEYTIIRAPYDGIVTNRYVEQGEVVSPGTAIMEGLSLSQLRVITHIPEKIINKVKSNPFAKIIHNNQEIKASKITIFPYADKSSRTFKARLDIETSQAELFPGMTVKVAFKTGEHKSLMIPKEALVTRGELIMVYVKSGENKILRHVKTGLESDDNIAIVSGLNAGDEILINSLSSNGKDKE